MINSLSSSANLRFGFEISRQFKLYNVHFSLYSNLWQPVAQFFNHTFTISCSAQMAQWLVDEWRIIFRNSSLFHAFFRLQKGFELSAVAFFLPNYSFHFYSPIYNLLRPGLCWFFFLSVLFYNRNAYIIQLFIV